MTTTAIRHSGMHVSRLASQFTAHAKVSTDVELQFDWQSGPLNSACIVSMLFQDIIWTLSCELFEYFRSYRYRSPPSTHRLGVSLFVGVRTRDDTFRDRPSA